ncbi:GNAT family N-acetyltransferase [Salipaludibacillus agaradhaerens]|uniref:GNAT family N-acetyltransferase n=1 Tax=Salipaludibacillus agaradhaerens TaxID=76935 RepID=UPI00356A6BC7
MAVTGEYIEQDPVYLIEKDYKIIAFYSFALKNKQLEALFIDPDYIGKGIGKLLWFDLLGKAKELNLKEFTLESEPYAEGFYLKMGAKKIGYTSSTVFRNLPLMKVKVI